MSSFLDSSGLSELATKLKAYFMKKPTTASTSSYPLVSYDSTNNVGKYNSDITLDIANREILAGNSTPNLATPSAPYSDNITMRTVTSNVTYTSLYHKPTKDMYVLVRNGGSAAISVIYGTPSSTSSKSLSPGYMVLLLYTTSNETWSLVTEPALSGGTYPNMTVGRVEPRMDNPSYIQLDFSNTSWADFSGSGSSSLLQKVFGSNYAINRTITFIGRNAGLPNDWETNTGISAGTMKWGIVLGFKCADMWVVDFYVNNTYSGASPSRVVRFGLGSGGIKTIEKFVVSHGASDVGSTSIPVYVKSDGSVEACFTGIYTIATTGQQYYKLADITFRSNNDDIVYAGVQIAATWRNSNGDTGSGIASITFSEYKTGAGAFGANVAGRVLVTYDRSNGADFLKNKQIFIVQKNTNYSYTLLLYNSGPQCLSYSLLSGGCTAFTVPSTATVVTPGSNLTKLPYFVPSGTTYTPT